MVFFRSKYRSTKWRYNKSSDGKNTDWPSSNSQLKIKININIYDIESPWPLFIVTCSLALILLITHDQFVRTKSIHYSVADKTSFSFEIAQFYVLQYKMCAIRYDIININIMYSLCFLTGLWWVSALRCFALIFLFDSWYHSKLYYRLVCFGLRSVGFK